MPVTTNPQICFGRPVITGTRIPVEELADRFLAGDSLAILAEDFAQPPRKIEEGLRWYFSKIRRKAGKIS